MAEAQAKSEASVVTVGLPESGKTTFLAALWHLICSGETDTLMQLEELRSGELAHLNAIAQRWRTARQQDRTLITRHRFVDMSLLTAGGARMRLVFPDIAGEAYRQIWEERECDQAIGEMLTNDAGILLFIHADMIRFPAWISDNLAVLAHEAGAEGEAEQRPWHASMAPTQVKLVDLLSVINDGSDPEGRRRLAIMFSAWDKAAMDKLTPLEFLAAKLPLLSQYLRQNSDRWETRVYGVSAQGCEYDSVDAQSRTADALAILAMDCPSKRIQLVHGNETSHDLTEPLAWLME